MVPKRGPFGDPFYHIPLGYPRGFLKKYSVFVRGMTLRQTRGGEMSTKCFTINAKYTYSKFILPACTKIPDAEHTK